MVMVSVLRVLASARPVGLVPSATPNERVPTIALKLGCVLMASANATFTAVAWTVRLSKLVAASVSMEPVQVLIKLGHVFVTVVGLVPIAPKSCCPVQAPALVTDCVEMVNVCVMLVSVDLTARPALMMVLVAHKTLIVAVARLAQMKAFAELRLPNQTDTFPQY